MSSDSDFPNNLKDFSIITRDETHVKDEINPARPGFRPVSFGGHGPVVRPPHALDAAQIERRDNSTDQPFRDMFEIYWEEHLNEILDAVCPVGNYFKFGPRLSSACNSWAPPSNISPVGDFNSTSNITATNHLGRRSVEASSATKDTPSLPSLGSNHIVALVNVASIFDWLEIVFHQPADNTAKHQALLDATEKLKALSGTIPEFAVLFGGRLRDFTLHSKYIRPSNTTTNYTATATKLASRDISSIVDRLRSNPNHYQAKVSFLKFKNSTLDGNNYTAQDQKVEAYKCNRKKKDCFCNTSSHGSHTTKSPACRNHKSKSDHANEHVHTHGFFDNASDYGCSGDHLPDVYCPSPEERDSRDQSSLFPKMDLKDGTKILEPTLIPRGEPSSVLREENKIGEEIEEPFEKIEEPFVELKDKTKSLPQKKIVPRIIGNARLAPGQGPLKYAYPFNIEIGDVLRSSEAPAESP
jgi:hypothetical protein